MEKSAQEFSVENLDLNSNSSPSRNLSEFDMDAFESARREDAKDINNKKESSWLSTSRSMQLLPIALTEMRKSAHEVMEQIWKLQLHQDLPGWRRDNEYLLANHRPVLTSLKACVASMFRFHSETFNIWTHFIGLVLLPIYAWFAMNNEEIEVLPRHETLVLNMHTTMGVLCFLFSTTFHILECHSPFVHEFFCRLDHFGIAGFVWAAKLAWIQSSSTFIDEGLTYALTLGANVVSAFSALLQFSGFFSRPSRRGFRTFWFVSSATLFVLLPLAEMLRNHGLDTALDVARIDLFAASLLSATVGMLFYVCHIPERFFPGRCDIYVQGHTLMHIFVNATIFLQVYGFRQSAINRIKWKSSSTTWTTWSARWFEIPDL